MKTRLCNKCNNRKRFSDFYKYKNGNPRSICKACALFDRNTRDCNNCNRALGYFKDNILILNNAISYLLHNNDL